MASNNASNIVLTRRMPEQFGRYTLLGRMTTGGMAEVFVARCGELMGMQTLVALKRILPVHAADDKFIQMFQREASIALRLSHRAIARVFEVGKVGNDWFLSIELVQGENLARVTGGLEDNGLRWDPNLIAFIGAEVASALHHAHTLADGRGRPLRIVHRDVSPENIMIGFDGSVKVIDFGIAMCESYASLTTQGAVRGKIQYVSPEQAQTHKLDGRSDVFSLGVVLYECLMGTQPFERTSPMATLDAVVNSEVDPIAHVAPAINDAIIKAMEKDPAKRYRDAGQFADALLQAIGGQDTGANKVAQLVSSLFPKRLARWNEIQHMAVDGFGFADKSTRDLATQTPPPEIQARTKTTAPADDMQKTEVEKMYAVLVDEHPAVALENTSQKTQARRRKAGLGAAAITLGVLLLGGAFALLGRQSGPPPTSVSAPPATALPARPEDPPLPPPAPLPEPGDRPVPAPAPDPSLAPVGAAAPPHLPPAEITIAVESPASDATAAVKKSGSATKKKKALRRSSKRGSRTKR